MNNLMVICVDVNDGDYVHNIIENISDEEIETFKKKLNKLYEVAAPFDDLREFYEERGNFPYVGWDGDCYKLDPEFYNDSLYAKYGLKREDVEEALGFYIDNLPFGTYEELSPHTITYIKVYKYNSVYDIRN